MGINIVVKFMLAFKLASGANVMSRQLCTCNYITICFSEYLGKEKGVKGGKKIRKNYDAQCKRMKDKFF